MIKFHCPNCQALNKVKDVDDLKPARNYHCNSCSKIIVANKSSFWLGLGADFLIYGVGSLLVVVLFLLGASLFASASPGLKLVLVAVIAICAYYGYGKLIELLRNKFLKLKVVHEI